MPQACCELTLYLKPNFQSAQFMQSAVGCNEYLFASVFI